MTTLQKEFYFDDNIKSTILSFIRTYTKRYPYFRKGLFQEQYYGKDPNDYYLRNRVFVIHKVTPKMILYDYWYWYSGNWRVAEGTPIRRKQETIKKRAYVEGEGREIDTEYSRFDDLVAIELAPIDHKVIDDVAEDCPEIAVFAQLEGGLERPPSAP